VAVTYFKVLPCICLDVLRNPTKPPKDKNKKINKNKNNKNNKQIK
jgi:hypothetical protein